MAQLANNNACTGCGACFSACSFNAITFDKNKFGFNYPKIDPNRCIDCKSCEKACPLVNRIGFNAPISVYAAHVSDTKERIESSSGGIGTLLAKHFIDNGGIVYGCAFVPPMSFLHIRCTDKRDIERLRGSKYAQSDIQSIYVKIKEDLRNGSKILFIGTPCQVAGVRRRFGNNENLTLVDLVCHGVPSSQFFFDTLPQSIKGSNIDSIKFREQNKYKITAYSDNSIVLDNKSTNDLFFKGFFTGITLRNSCFSCIYAKPDRISDLTIGDFWGLKSEKIGDCEKGVSMIMINTNTGVAVFESIKNNIIFEERHKEDAISNNEQLNHPHKRTFRERIFKMLYPFFGYQFSLILSIPERVIYSKIKTIFFKNED